MSQHDHLHALGCGWALWRWICVRGAGFAAERVLALSAVETSAALDRVVELELELAAARTAAVAVVEADRATRTVPAEQRAFTSPLRRLRAGVIPAAFDELGAASRSALDALRAVSAELDRARAAASATATADRPRLARAVREVARDARFREALQWQNRTALTTGIDALLRQSETASDSKTRQHERLVASYLQRYCTKNDTIGFFGPVGWAQIGGELSVRPGPSLLAARMVYFEHWGIDLLASSLARDPRLRRYAAPRRHPATRLEGTTLHHGIDRRSELPLEYARLLAACDGERSARAIALELLRDPELELAGEDEVYDLLDELASQRAAIWTFEISPNVEHPDRVLGALVDAVEDRDAAATAAASVAELQAARDDVARVADDPIALDRALARLDATFTRHTGEAARRRPGEMYAGRALVFEDCRRDLAIELGPAVIDPLAAPLSLLLASARWFTYTVAQRYREVLVALHRELAREHGSAIPFLRFWARASDQFGDSRDGAPLVRETTDELQRRWAELVGLHDEAFARRRLDLGVDELAPRVARVFAAPHPGWPSARHQSPDVMIGATDLDALARGELVAVMGELHIACATVMAPWNARLHPDPAELVTAMTRDRPLPVVDAVVATERANRSNRFSIVAHDVDLELGTARSPRPRDHVVEAGELVVEAAGDTLRVCTRDGRHQFALEQFLDSFLTNVSVSQFRPVETAPHVPRVTIGGLVIKRETWQFEPAQLAFAHVDDPFERMLAARRWVRAHQLPRFMFYKVPQETKPVYLDACSPHFVELFAYLARKATEVVVSEMLPSLDQVWLPDAHGGRYTSELRLVAVDPEPWRAEP